MALIRSCMLHILYTKLCSRFALNSISNVLTICFRVMWTYYEQIIWPQPQRSQTVRISETYCEYNSMQKTSLLVVAMISSSLQWRHSGRDGVSNHQAHDCLLNRIFKAGIKENFIAQRHCLYRGPVNLPHKGPEGKCYHLMTSSCGPGVQTPLWSSVRCAKRPPHGLIPKWVFMLSNFEE